MKKIFTILLLFISALFLSACELLEQFQGGENKTIYVSFDTYGGELIEKTALNDLAELPIPTKNGYLFQGWFYDRDFTEEATDDNILLITKSTSIYAYFEAETTTFTVSFVDYDGRLIYEEDVSYLASATAPTSPTREGYIFKGWNRDFSSVTSNLIVTATYEKEAVVSYTISFDSKGGGNINSINVIKNEIINSLPIPIKEGVAFLHWTYEGNIIITPLSFTYNKDVVFEAVYEEDTGELYTISFDSKGGGNINSMSVRKNKLIDSLPIPNKTGATFLHWIYEGYIINTPTIFTYDKDVVFEAVYTTTYYSNGTTVNYRGITTNKVEIPDTYASREKEFRGLWVSFIVGDISSFYSKAQMQSQLTEVLDNLVSWNMNAIVFHIRTHNDAYYDTNLAPKSSYIASANFAEWDYLEWFIEECHARNIEFHAWLNPYRLPNATRTVEAVLAHYQQYPNNPASQAVNLLQGTSTIILNPGEPAVRQYLIDTCMEIIEKYDVDAIHFDDYFYISMDANADEATYNKYKASSQTTNIADWRREQVDIFIRDLSQTMRANNDLTGRKVELGISPSGIWRNGSGSTSVTYVNGTAQTNGSNTSGWQHYGDYLYSDSKKWIDEEWIDYIVPQTYWGFTHPAAQYAELADWWSKVVRHKNVKLYMGMGIYMPMEPGEVYSWKKNPYEASDQVLYNSKHPEIDGVCIYRYFYIKNLLNSENPGTLRLINEYWLEPVPTP